MYFRDDVRHYLHTVGLLIPVTDAASDVKETLRRRRVQAANALAAVYWLRCAACQLLGACKYSLITLFILVS